MLSGCMSSNREECGSRNLTAYRVPTLVGLFLAQESPTEVGTLNTCNQSRTLPECGQSGLAEREARI